MAEAFGSIDIDLVKLRDYCLSEAHPRGKHKARVFRARLGLTARDAELLRELLIAAVEAQREELVSGENDAFGRRYLLDARIVTASGSATVRTAWIVRTGEDALRLVTCYVL